MGVWALLLLMTVAYVRIARAAPPAERGPRSPRTWAFGAGAFCLWAALDWPLGALAAGYLASLHMVQFLLVGVIAPALLLLGLPVSAYLRLRTEPRMHAALRALTHPLIAFVLFNLVVAFTHWPAVVDGLMPSQLGSFAIDALWFAGGTVFWWPVVCPVPERPRFTYPLKIGYLILNTVASTAPFAYLTFSSLPVYATYELAPPIEGITKRADQQLAGILMKIGGGLILWTAITALFVRWYREDEARPARLREAG